jgi:hypothetical protein
MQLPNDPHHWTEIERGVEPSILFLSAKALAFRVASIIPLSFALSRR